MKPALEGRDIVCFAGEDWWYHNPHSNLHIMKAFAKHNRVLFVNSIGVRMPSFTADKFFWKRVGGKLRSLARYLKKAGPNLHVLTPVAVPAVSGAVDAANKRLLVFQVELAMKLLGFKDPVIWATLPTAKDAAIHLRRRGQCLAYYCTDNVSYQEGADQKRIFSLDTGLQSAADVAFFVNHRLMEERKNYNSNTHHLTHGVDYEHFAQARGAKLPVPEDLKDIPRPIAGHMGAIRDLDFDLVARLAQEHPGVSFVFIGEVYSDTRSVLQKPNVHFLGKKPYEALPAYLQNFDAHCLFYKTGGPWIDYSNPKKLLEYLATGKPVVSVWIPELEYAEKLIYFGRTYEEYSAALGSALAEKSEERAAERMRFAASHTWDDVAEAAGEEISKCLRKNP